MREIEQNNEGLWEGVGGGRRMENSTSSRGVTLSEFAEALLGGARFVHLEHVEADRLRQRAALADSHHVFRGDVSANMLIGNFYKLNKLKEWSNREKIEFFPWTHLNWENRFGNLRTFCFCFLILKKWNIPNLKAGEQWTGMFLCLFSYLRYFLKVEDYRGETSRDISGTKTFQQKSILFKYYTLENLIETFLSCKELLTK